MAKGAPDSGEVEAYAQISCKNIFFFLNKAAWVVCDEKQLSKIGYIYWTCALQTSVDNWPSIWAMKLKQQMES